MTNTRHLHLLFILGCVMLFGGCGTATMRGIDESIHFNPAGKTTIFRDTWVQRNPPEVHVQPISGAPSDLRVLFLPFRVTQQIENPTILGYGTARTIWQTWLTMQLFPVLEFSSDSVPYRRDRAVQLARMRHADMVVGGFVTYVYAGGTVGDSQIAVQLEALDTKTGQIVWSMAQSGIIPAPRTNDYFLFNTKTKMPSDPLHAIAQVLAVDMGQKVGEWLHGPSVSTTSQKVDQKVYQTLFPPRDPVPAPGAGYDSKPEEDEEAPASETPLYQ